MSARFPLFLGGILLLLWPAFLNGGPLVFFDSASYLDQGRQAVEEALRLVSSRLSPGAGGEGAGAVAAEGAASANIFRSVAYSVFAYAASATPLGEWGIITLHSVLIVTLLAMLAGRGLLEAARPADIALAMLVCAALTSLPWFVSYLMPDILAAVVILCGMLVAAGLERLNPWGKLFVFGAASFAMLSHYGHIPLGVAVGATALGLLLLQRRLTVAAVAVAALPVLVALGGNAVVNRVAFHEPGVGVATKRLPVLLARSLADGPARWHLEENCDTEGYAICEVFEDGFSSNLGVILWSDEGLGGASPDQMDRIRAEEATILRRAFMEYPAAQIWSFAGNAVSQTWTFGMDDFSWSRLKWLPDGNVDTAMPDPDRSRAGLDAVGGAHLAALIAAILLILLYAWRDGLGVGRREREILFLVVAGLVINAAIFGGLSVPVDRYQGRVVWIVPALAALFWLTRRDVHASPPVAPPASFPVPSSGPVIPPSRVRLIRRLACGSGHEGPPDAPCEPKA